MNEIKINESILVKDGEVYYKKELVNKMTDDLNKVIEIQNRTIETLMKATIRALHVPATYGVDKC